MLYIVDYRNNYSFVYRSENIVHFDIYSLPREQKSFDKYKNSIKVKANHVTLLIFTNKYILYPFYTQHKSTIKWKRETNH